MPKGIYPGNKNKIISEKTKAIHSKHNSDTGNPSWKGGRINYMKRIAKKRDNYTCQKCGLRDIDIVVIDHVIPKSLRPDLFSSLENLMTLCPNCHARKCLKEKRAKIYGRWKDKVTPNSTKYIIKIIN